jgi:hypothetical protein
MSDSERRHSWIWHPMVATLAAVVGVVGFVAALSPSLSNPPLAASFVAAGGVALVTALYVTVLTPRPNEARPEYNWWIAASWVVGIVLTEFVMAEARRPGGVLWPTLILTALWFVAVFRAIPAERATRPARAVLAAGAIGVGVAMAPFAWSGDWPMPALDGAAIGYLWGLAFAAVFVQAGQSWRRIGAVLLLAVSVSSLTGMGLPIVPALMTAYLLAWARLRRMGSALEAKLA